MTELMANKSGTGMSQSGMDYAKAPDISGFANIDDMQGQMKAGQGLLHPAVRKQVAPNVRGAPNVPEYLKGLLGG